MKAFLERNGIFKGWLCEGAGIPRHVFDYRLEHGFSDNDEIFKLERFLHEKGKELLGFKFGVNNEEDIELLRTKFGIIASHLATCIKQTRDNFRSTLERKLRTREQEVLEYELKRIARDMLEFSLPVSLKKAA